MQVQTSKEPRKRKNTQSIQQQQSAASEKKPVRSQSGSPCEDLQARITNRAHELYVDRGYREGHALDDWLEAEREILGLPSVRT
ncbi:MAG: DUF2934 domain-containing protein [Nitrospira sp.]